MKLKNNRAAIILLLFFVYHGIFSCSVVGYVGFRLCKEFILKGLSRLEYRGYDSAGFCSLDPITHDLVCSKSVGKLETLKKKLLSEEDFDGHIGIGHTRWATHGGVTNANAHPHSDCHNTVAVVHNGIIENYNELKTRLINDGHTFTSETDTEVIAHLLRIHLDQQNEADVHSNLKNSAIELAANLEGSYGLICMVKDYPDMLLVMRCRSPLSVGLGKGETFIASDVIAYADKTKDVLFLPDESFAIVTKSKVTLYDFQGNELEQHIRVVDLDPMTYEKMDHEHFMLKEIYEQPCVIRASIKHYQELGNDIFKQFGLTQKDIQDLESIHMVGCGTSWHAGLIGKFFFEYVAKIPAYVHLASEFLYMPLFSKNNTVFIAISQSGETADTLEAVRLIKRHGMPVSTITNVVTSNMVRETDGLLETKAGPEIAVASTKAFTTQLTALYWLAHMIAKEKGLLSEKDLEKAAEQLHHAASVLEQAIDKYKVDMIDIHGKKYAKAPHMLFLGRHVMYPLALESALKLKEITYIPSHGGPAGELKHGTLALVDFSIPVVLFSHLDPLLYKKVLANAQEIKARKGQLIVCAFEGQTELCNLADVAFVLPRVEPLLAPLATVGLMQFFAYQVAKALGHDIDKPRNLAKAVTVE